MDDEKLKRQIGKNIALFRKRLGLTQAGLAEKINYSDKAISKWERGESVPDVLTMVSLAQELGVTVDVLVSDQDALPSNTGPVQQAMEQVVEKTLKRKADKRIILGLSSVLVWFVALLLYVIFASLDIPNSWLAFVYAIPTNAVVSLCLRSAWRDYHNNKWIISAIVWGALLSLYLTLYVVGQNVWRVLLLGIPGQLAVLLWFRLFRTIPVTETENGQKRTEKTDS